MDLRSRLSSPTAPTAGQEIVAQAQATPTAQQIKVGYNAFISNMPRETDNSDDDHEPEM